MSIKKPLGEMGQCSGACSQESQSPPSLLTACGVLFAWLLPSGKMPINTSSDASLVSRAGRGASLLEPWAP